MTYGYQDVAIWKWLTYAHVSWDCFHVGLRLKDDAEISLFTSIGKGNFTNDGPFPDLLYWREFLFDVAGSQDRDSRSLLDLLSWMLIIKVVPSQLVT